MDWFKYVLSTMGISKKSISKFLIGNRFHVKKKKLNPKAMITYKRPTTIGQKLTNYKDLALIFFCWSNKLVKLATKILCLSRKTLRTSCGPKLVTGLFVGTVNFSSSGKKHFCKILPLGEYGLVQVCTFHDGCKQGIDQQIFNRKSISRKKKLNPKAMITYKRPTTIGQKLTNYKELALNKTRKQTKGGSRPCEHCALCGWYGKNNKSMVPNDLQLLTKTKTFKLNQSLTCADFGIYVATCVICHEQYVGQTSNKFSKR